MEYANELVKKMEEHWTNHHQVKYDEACKRIWEQQWGFSHKELQNLCLVGKSVGTLRHNTSCDLQTLCSKERSATDEIQTTFLANKDKFLIGWSQKYNELVMFVSEHGHCNVPKIYPPNQALVKWINDQRTQFKRHKAGKRSYINKKHIILLNNIGFLWTSQHIKDALWQQRFEELVKFKEKYGHCDVPKRFPSNEPFGEWVATQRREFKKAQAGKKCAINSYRFMALEKLGFKWKVRTGMSWEERYGELLEFEKQYGHCNVPRNYDRNKNLGEWVHRQRRAKKNRGWNPGRLTEKHVEALNKVGFQWSLRKT